MKKILVLVFGVMVFAAAAHADGDKVGQVPADKVKCPDVVGAKAAKGDAAAPASDSAPAAPAADAAAADAK